ncbi:MAG: hypothetical protein M8467_10080 [Anaerolineae bacterium]|nr:hypothetical protein [Anaerolineae bacterium]
MFTMLIPDAPGAGLGVLAVVTLLVILTIKEFARDSNSPRLQSLPELLNVAIVPLMLAFLIDVVVHILRALH